MDTVKTRGLPWMGRAGWVLTGLVTLVLLGSAAMKFGHSPQTVAAFAGHFGYHETTLLPLAVVETTVALLYVAAPTSVVGGILATGYLGGAIATHVRVGESFVAPLVIGVLVWVSLFLRKPALRALLAPRA